MSRWDSEGKREAVRRLIAKEDAMWFSTHEEANTCILGRTPRREKRAKTMAKAIARADAETEAFWAKYDAEHPIVDPRMLFGDDVVDLMLTNKDFAAIVGLYGNDARVGEDIVDWVSGVIWLARNDKLIDMYTYYDILNDAVGVRNLTS